MSTRIAVVDAFTSRAFAGNPAGVCLLENPVPDSWMQSLAAEMRHAETAFLLPLSHPRVREQAPWSRDGSAVADLDPARSFLLRWFTPRAEVNLCGHATLASAHYLFESGVLKGDDPIAFYTRSDVLHVQPEGDRLKMDFPAVPVTATAQPDWLLRVLPGVEYELIGTAGEDRFVVVPDAASVRALQPDLALLRSVRARGLTVTAPGDQSYDCVSRFFAPAVGVDEDPVTGSAHCALGPYWAARLGKREVRCFQASPRGGELTVRVHGDRVDLLGVAVTVLSGTLRISP